ncbi:OmpA/MotB family protein [Fundidesulfovibrio soli]|uniref:OmpA/MotB family protein n=1 Tax=Fundidesulfovibrio soli TaxID=2922716 RepID=UPI001FAF5B41|nr:flagellar motor protein MotB [Fundidesulfovibrio soli]
MSKNKPAPIIIKREEEGHAAPHGGSWKVAYADFVTAMMALFLLLWLTMALKPQVKEQIAMFFQDQDLPKREKPQETAVLPTYVAKDSTQGTPQFKLSQEEKYKYEVALMIKQLMDNNPNLKQNSGISSDKVGVLLHVNNAVMFQPGSPQLKPEAYKLLDDVVGVLKKIKVDLVVRGHTDDAESGNGMSKFELSAMRAASCVRYIVEKGGIPSTRVKAAAYADSQPIAPNTSDQNRSINRRVEFLYHSPEMANLY